MTEKGLFRLLTNASKLENTLRLRSGQAKKGKGVYETLSSFVLSYPAKLTAGKLRAFVIGLWCFAAYSIPLTAYLISALDFGSGLDIA